MPGSPADEHEAGGCPARVASQALREDVQLPLACHERRPLARRELRGERPTSGAGVRDFLRARSSPASSRWCSACSSAAGRGSELVAQQHAEVVIDAQRLGDVAGRRRAPPSGSGSPSRGTASGRRARGRTLARRASSASPSASEAAREPLERLELELFELAPAGVGPVVVDRRAGSRAAADRAPRSRVAHVSTSARPSPPRAPPRCASVASSMSDPDRSGSRAAGARGPRSPPARAPDAGATGSDAAPACGSRARARATARRSARRGRAARSAVAEQEAEQRRWPGRPAAPPRRGRRSRARAPAQPDARPRPRLAHRNSQAWTGLRTPASWERADVAELVAGPADGEGMGGARDEHLTRLRARAESGGHERRGAPVRVGDVDADPDPGVVAGLVASALQLLRAGERGRRVGEGERAARMRGHRERPLRPASGGAAPPTPADRPRGSLPGRPATSRAPSLCVPVRVIASAGRREINCEIAPGGPLRGAARATASRQRPPGRSRAGTRSRRRSRPRRSGRATLRARRSPAEPRPTRRRASPAQ